MSQEAFDGWVSLGKLLRTRGIRGEVVVEAYASGADRFEKAGEVVLLGAGREPRRLQVERAWQHQGRVVLKFTGIETISEAETLRGAEVCVPAAARAPAPEGAYYESELIGCCVLRKDTGAELGRVTALQMTGEARLLELDSGLLIPFARSICVEIDPERRRIVVDPPDGLEELNRS